MAGPDRFFFFCENGPAALGDRPSNQNKMKSSAKPNPKPRICTTGAFHEIVHGVGVFSECQQLSTFVSSTRCSFRRQISENLFQFHWSDCHQMEPFLMEPLRPVFTIKYFVIIHYCNYFLDSLRNNYIQIINKFILAN